MFSIIGKKQYFACDGDKEIIFDNWGVCLMEKFQDKYRIQSARLKDWDYSSAGAYFITICTRDRIHFFGEIVNGKMAYTPLGIRAETLWHEIKRHTKNIELGEFVVMPNHIHGILMIPPVETLHATSPYDVGHATSPDENRAAIPGGRLQDLRIKNDQMATISPKPGTISAIIRSYKSAVTRQAARSGLTFGWQPRFHDHIIRDAASYCRIATYIAENPNNWETDKFYGVETLHATSPHNG